MTTDEWVEIDVQIDEGRPSRAARKATGGSALQEAWTHAITPGPGAHSPEDDEPREPDPCDVLPFDARWRLANASQVTPWPDRIRAVDEAILSVMRQYPRHFQVDAIKAFEKRMADEAKVRARLEAKRAAAKAADVAAQ